MSGGTISGSNPIGADRGNWSSRRRSYLLQVNLTERRRTARRQVEVLPVRSFGAALHYAVVFVDAYPAACAYVERVKSAKDRAGRGAMATPQRSGDCGAF